ncbi:MAG: acetate kinase [Halieaceae bacterium]|jgi:acetate kinase|nr:acetate kinase [Halieaceae bacterium]
MNILVLNCGSSSIKFAVYGMDDSSRLIWGQIEAPGTARGRFSAQTADEQFAFDVASSSYSAAIQTICAFLDKHRFGPGSIEAIGHRVVHAGEHYSESVIINDDVIAAIKACCSLAPLHNPINLKGILQSMAHYPGITQVAVFDTAFHQSIPKPAFMYAIPTWLYEQQGIRRYGFHGTSHRYVAQEAAALLRKPLDQLDLITAHLGNGCSATAVKKGESVDTSMGLTPLDGLVMGTRSGSVDPGLHAFLADTLDWDVEKTTTILNTESGLLGLSGTSQDMRELTRAAEAGDQDAALAIEVFCYRLARELCALAMPLGRLDALVFTGGIGENSRLVRAKTLGHLGLLGLHINPQANDQNGRSTGGRISDQSEPVALVIPTNEELLIATDALRLKRQLEHFPG